MQILKIGANYGLNRNTISKAQIKPVNLKMQNDVFEKNDISFKSNMDYYDKRTVKYSVDWGYRQISYTDNPQYAIYHPKQHKLNLLNGSENHVKKVAEALCMYTNEDIANFTKIYHPFSKELDEEKSIKAFRRIMPQVIKQREQIASLWTKRKKLNEKAERGELSVKDNEDFELFCVNKEIERIEKKEFAGEKKIFKIL